MRRLLNVLLAISIILISCKQKEMDAYKELVEKEQHSGKRVDSLFMDIKLGMKSNDFYLYCWQKNKEGIFSDGSANTSVAYQLDSSELRHPAEMNFYPEFVNGYISGMWAKFQYKGWMPWNKELGSEKLLPDVLELYKRWYPEGNPFLELNDPERGTIYVKVDGNRRIILGRFDDVQVKADYTDLSIDQNQLR